MTVRLDEMSWPEIKEALNKPHVVILPLGSTEQHGTHLPVNVDSVSTTYTAERAAEKVVNEHNICVLVAPTIHYTEVSHYKMFPGNIGVKADTLIRVIAEVVASFLDQGFKNIIALTNHRENLAPLEVALTLTADNYPEANIFGINIVGLGSGLPPMKAGIAGIGHGLEVETAKALVIQPQNVHLDRAVIGWRRLPLPERYIGASGYDQSKGVIYCSGIKGFGESGTLGDPTKASKDEGEIFLSAAINDLADIIVQIVKPKQQS